VIGVDHLAFIIGIGIASAFIAPRLLGPLVFVLATLAGCAMQLAGVALPLAEIVIAGSVVVLGVLILSGATVPSAAYLALFAVAGLFHGWAYGESIVGAEQTPLVAYLAGFAAIQMAIAAGAMLVTRGVWEAASAVPLRIAGGAIAGFGFAFLVENVEKIAFPGVAG
jgi:urease accessory protein